MCIDILESFSDFRKLTNISWGSWENSSNQTYKDIHINMLNINNSVG